MSSAPPSGRKDPAATRLEFHILLAAEKHSEVIVKPAAAVVACVDNNSVAITIFAKDTVVDSLETFAIHASYMHISDFSTREAVCDMLITLNPSLVSHV